LLKTRGAKIAPRAIQKTHDFSYVHELNVS
jgi:hypothetical protein